MLLSCVSSGIFDENMRYFLFNGKVWIIVYIIIFCFAYIVTRKQNNCYTKKGYKK